MSVLDLDQLGAFCRHTHVEVDGAPAGPLSGLTFGLKDIYDVAGHRTGFGSPDWLATHDAAAVHSAVAQCLLDSGAHLLGKTHTEEMAFSITGENAHYGTPRNPAAPGRVPGGSSSGSASAVAGGFVDFAIGSDTGGSVRAPASFCGIYGIRPTHGRISMAGAAPLAPSFDTCGWFARDAEMLSRVGDALLGGNAAKPGRLLFARDAFALAVPDALRALQPAVDLLSALFGPTTEVTVAEEGLNKWFDVFRISQFGEIWETHGEWVSRVHPTFGPAIAQRFATVAKMDLTEVAGMRPLRAAIAARVDAMLADNAIMLLPSMPDIAPLLNSPADDTIAFRERAMGMLCIAGLAGVPQVSLPLATVNGCPVGLSIMAARGNDEMLLDAARHVHRHIHRHPLRHRTPATA